MRYITPEEAVKLHYLAINEFFRDLGGDPEDHGGVRSPDGLLSALHAPLHTFDGKELHQGLVTKAAVLMRSLIQNHPFHNGNKRTAVLVVLMFLECNGYALEMTNTKLIRLATSVAVHHRSIHRIKRDLEKHLREVPRAEMRTSSKLWRFVSKG